jgi:hypothetical protein
VGNLWLAVSAFKFKRLLSQKDYLSKNPDTPAQYQIRAEPLKKAEIATRDTKTDRKHDGNKAKS